MNIILCSVPGAVSAWRNFPRETVFVAWIYTKLGSTKENVSQRDLNLENKSRGVKARDNSLTMELDLIEKGVRVQL